MQQWQLILAISCCYYCHPREPSRVSHGSLAGDPGACCGWRRRVNYDYDSDVFFSLPVRVVRRRPPENGVVQGRVVIARRALRGLDDAPAEVLLVLHDLGAVSRHLRGRGRRWAGRARAVAVLVVVVVEVVVVSRARHHRGGARVANGHGPARYELHEHGGRPGPAAAAHGRHDAPVSLDQRLQRLGARRRRRRRRLRPAQLVLRCGRHLGIGAPRLVAAAVLGLRRGVRGALLALVHHVLAEPIVGRRAARAGALVPVRVRLPPGGGRGSERLLRTGGRRGHGGRVEQRGRRRGRVQALGALEHVLPPDHRVDVVVVGEIVPHEPVPVAPALQFQQRKHVRAWCTKLVTRKHWRRRLPLGRPRVHARHAIASQRVEPVDHIYAHSTAGQQRRTRTTQNARRTPMKRTAKRSGTRTKHV